MIGRIARSASTLAGLAVLAIVVLISLDVLMRFFFNQPQLFVDEVASFLEADRKPEQRVTTVDVAAKLSPRELDVLRLAAEGEDNDAIAERLTLSVRTIERHLHNVYTKLGLHGKSARAAAVSRLLTRA